MSSPLLEVQHLSTFFPIRRGIFSRTIGQIRAVDDVSLQIAPGEAVGLVGESGCGKSTLARSLLMLQPPTAGQIIFNNTDLTHASKRAIRKARSQMQVVFQDPYASLNPGMTVMQLVTEGLTAQGLLDRNRVPDAAATLLKDVGLDPDMCNRFPHEFSGGQRQRICIARAIALRPSLLICDEAVSALDVSVQAQIINLLMSLRKQNNLAFLFISHDLSVVAHFCDRIAVMYLGKIVETGPAHQIMNAPRHPYTRALMNAIPKVGAAKREKMRLPGELPSPSNPPQGCRFHPRCPFATAECRQSSPELSDVAGATHHKAACWYRNNLPVNRIPEQELPNSVSS